MLAKPNSQRTMLDRIVKPERLLQIRTTLNDLPGIQQRYSHHAMTCKYRAGCPLLLSKRKELRRIAVHQVTVEIHNVRGLGGV